MGTKLRLESHKNGGRLRYQVSLAARTRGLLLSVHRGDTRISARQYRETTCWEFLHGRDRACSSCPLFGDAGDRKRAFAVLDTESDTYLLLDVQRGAGKAEVRVMCLGEPEVAALCMQKLRKLAAHARLSAQEIRVFELMTNGLQTKEMAATLGLSGRTVKFHGTNLLRKLQVTSRLGLLRIMTRSIRPRRGAADHDSTESS